MISLRQGPSIDSHISESCREFVTIVDHILRQLTYPKFHTFELCYFEPYQSTKSEVLSIGPSRILTPLVRLPPCLFQAQSLVKLELSRHALVFNFPDHRIVRLPNLKTLTSVTIDKIVGSHRELMRLLFKSCPLLEHLHLRFMLVDNGHVVDISAPNLKTLNLAIDGGIKFVIDTPTLKYFRTLWQYSLLSLRHCTNHITLQKSWFIPTILIVRSTDYLSNILVLVRGISSVRSLVLRNNTLTLSSFLSRLDDSALPIFRNLTHLKASCDVSEEMNWSAPLPACLFANLKSVHVSTISLHTDEITLVENVLSNAKNLEELLVLYYDFSE